MCEVYSTSCCEDVMCTVGTRRLLLYGHIPSFCEDVDCCAMCAVGSTIGTSCCEDMYCCAMCTVTSAAKRCILCKVYSTACCEDVAAVRCTVYSTRYWYLSCEVLN